MGGAVSGGKGGGGMPQAQPGQVGSMAKPTNQMYSQMQSRMAGARNDMMQQRMLQNYNQMMQRAPTGAPPPSFGGQYNTPGTPYETAPPPATPAAGTLPAPNPALAAATTAAAALPPDAESAKQMQLAAMQRGMGPTGRGIGGLGKGGPNDYSSIYQSNLPKYAQPFMQAMGGVGNPQAQKALAQGYGPQYDAMMVARQGGGYGGRSQQALNASYQDFQNQSGGGYGGGIGTLAAMRGLGGYGRMMGGVGFADGGLVTPPASGPIAWNAVHPAAVAAAAPAAAIAARGGLPTIVAPKAMPRAEQVFIPQAPVAIAARPAVVAKKPDRQFRFNHWGGGERGGEGRSTGLGPGWGGGVAGGVGGRSSGGLY